MVERNLNNSEFVAEVQVRDGEVIRVSRDIDHGRCRVNVREWFKDEDGEWRAGRGGITIKRENAAQIVGAILNAATGRR